MKNIENINAVPDWRWQAVKTKDGKFDGAFYFGVRTTGIFCRPSCSSKMPKRENVDFFPDASAAAAAGYRPCLRCKPTESYSPAPAAALFIKALELLLSSVEDIATVEELAGRSEVSTGHLQKTFRSIVGLSPKEVLDLLRLEKFKQRVRSDDVITSLYDSGFGSSRSLYEKAGERLGMTPAVYKKGGKNMRIKYTIGDCKLGKIMVAATEKGICTVSFGETDTQLEEELKAEFWAAEISRDDRHLRDAVDTILRSLDGEKAILTLPLDIKASAFQMRVWAELRKIPYGETRSYSEIAAKIGNPAAVRAVARACATNPVALVNPCHRVIASDGKLSGYKWGIDRKAKILAQERGEKVSAKAR